MVGPIRVDGLVSGIDFTSIIEKMLAVQRRPAEQQKAKIELENARKTAYLELNVQLLSLKSSTSLLAGGRIYASSKAASSNEAVLAATDTTTAVPGAYTFTPRRLAQASQLLSNGFADPGTTSVAVAAGVIRVQSGGIPVDAATDVAYLNGQTGFDRGLVKITDTSGRSGTVDLRSVSDVREIVEAINASTSVSVRAGVQGNRLVLEDLAGGAGTLRVENFGADQTASSLGIAGVGTLVGSSQYVFGGDILTLSGGNSLDSLNSGLGIRRNADLAADFTLVDTDGTSVQVDLAASVTTLQGVVDRINTSAAGAGSSLTASLSTAGNALVLSDAAGTQAIVVASASDSFAAADLGLGRGTGAGFVQEDAEDATTGAPDPAAGNRVVGRSLLPGMNGVQRDLLNGGTSLGTDLKGVAEGSVAITDRAGVATSVNVSSRVAASLTAVVDSKHLTLSTVNGFAVGNRIRVQTTAGAEYRTVVEISGTTVGFDRSLSGTATAGNTVFGLNESLSDIVRTLNQGTASAGVSVSVSVNAQGNGLTVEDASGATASNLIVTGTPATDLGIAASAASTRILGTDLDPRHLGENTLLSKLNGGDGVVPGKLKITDRQGRAFTVDLSQASDNTLGRVLLEINAAAAAAGNLSFTARINDGGDGILLSDGGGGGGTLTVEEVEGGRTARDLNLLGSARAAAPGTIDGSFERSVDIDPNSTLQEIADQLNRAQVGVSATVINDGSSLTPYRLSLTGTRTGKDNRIFLDTDIPGLTFAPSALAQDALLLFGGGEGAVEPALISSDDNRFSGVVPGLSLEVKGTSASPVTVTVTRDTQAVADQVGRFVETYNQTLLKIKQLTGFDPETFDKGLLFGEGLVRRIQQDLASLVSRSVRELPASQLDALSEVGLTLTEEGGLAFDSALFGQKLSADFDGVRQLFSKQRQLGVSTPLSDLNNGRGITQGPGADFRIKARDGTSFDIDLAGVSTVGALLNSINNATGNAGKIVARIGVDGFSLELLDSSAVETNPLSVTNLNGSSSATELKIAKTLGAGENVLRGDILLLRGDPGVASRFDERLDVITREDAGLISRRSESLLKAIERMESTVERIEERLARQQDHLIRRFARLEGLIASSQSAQQRLQGLLAGILGN
jgi:flagellar hook-associated protein 2